jgi:putative nucleotidyltransferase with HDIG domain
MIAQREAVPDVAETRCLAAERLEWIEPRIAQAEEKLRLTVERLNRVVAQTAGALACTSELRDPYTAGHQRSVGRLAEAIGREMGLSESRLEGLRVGGILHDIGKISVPSEILAKPGPINPAEFALIKMHPGSGFNILREIDFPWPVAAMTHQHHERLDGSGYPHHLRARDIILEARILAVADVVEAMANHRPYRPALGIDTAMAEIYTKSGTAFDRDVVKSCMNVIAHGFGFETVEEAALAHPC